ncbi:polyprenol phosphomannose-dependent alpha 1,6 mannosyltransferase MptB [Herbiconiux sp. KACC 21604]|uniref:polyprenol phosphomannose-dependent alpha 1,6 mannosyltransferase MptB n=1 Tax=unclassified Herbiconiux TaxID=2618217 RepID=UPI0014911C33|nr:polyprenol phosphomannose-dependent alpha 1,6 mannosyltransferase MptB [Herbiconiux sp. SALV-R1]QJU55383.1 polyprenol phosphomannose-dependent alpha 1,6 mannosyltransferase MptB [Herbiconiux sp. SALV-R1]WPO86556.1 polyprenol phosphomannose-dependent alpha 1,6 mannosyltransferase MptB [Herbiconiux sp. KACC 21604]
MQVIPPRARLALGLAGSVSILAGSYAVGWVGPASTLHDLALLEFLRNSRGAVVVGGVLMVAGTLALLFAWLTLGVSLLRRAGGRDRLSTAERREHERVRLVQVVTSAAVWAAPLVFTLPLFSRDMFAYVGQGRLMAAGLNPYSDGMASLPGWYGIGVDPLWADAQTPYGPVFVWLERVVVMATDALPTEVAVFTFRLLAVFGLAMLAYYAWRIARLRGLDEAGVLWIVAASPLVLMNFVVAGHNDSLMLGFIVGGVYYALRDRPVLGAVFIGIAIGVKPIALIALPIIGLIWAGRRAGWGVVIRRWLAVAAIAIGFVVVLGWGIGVGVGWISALATPTAVSSWYAPANIIGMSLGGLANGVGLDGALVQEVVKLALLAVGCTAAIYLMLRKRDADPLWLLLGCFAAIVLLSPVIHPWYALWLLTLLAIAGRQRLWSIRTVVYATTFFVLIGLAEPLDMIPRIDADARIEVVVIGAALLGVAAILVSTELLVRRRAAGLVLRTLSLRA